MESAVVEQFVQTLWDDVASHYKIKTAPIHITVSYDKRRTKSWGGARIEFQDGLSIRPYVIIAMNMVDKKHFPSKKVVYTEYPAIEKHKIIGSIRKGRKKAWQAIAAHEVAHAAEFFLKKPPKDLSGCPAFKDHNASWAHIYQYLRIKYVNNTR